MSPSFPKILTSTAALVLALGLALDASAQKPKQSQGQQSPQTLDTVDAKLNAYATAAARASLGDRAKAGEDPAALIRLGRILEQEKKYKDAEARLKKAGQLAPKSPAPWIYLGEAYRHQKRDKDARVAFQEAEKRASALVARNASSSSGHYYLGVARQQLGKHAPAAASLKKAGNLAPEDPLPVYQLGVTEAVQKNWQAAVDQLTRAIEMNSDLAYAYYFRGQAASKLKRKDLLIADLERFLELAPEAPEAPLAARTVAAARRW